MSIRETTPIKNTHIFNRCCSCVLHRCVWALQVSSLVTGRKALNADSASCQPLYWPKTLLHYPAAGPFCSPPPLSRAHPPLHPSSSPSLHIFISPPLKKELCLSLPFFIILGMRLLVKGLFGNKEIITVRKASESQIKLHHNIPLKHLKLLYTLFSNPIFLSVKIIKSSMASVISSKDYLVLLF